MPPEPDDEPPDRDDDPSVEPEGARYLLRLFVSGMTPRSTVAIARIKSICEEHLNGRYDLEVIDIYQQPDAAKVDQIVATPTLIKKLPAPLRRLVGDLSDKERVLLGLNISEN
jgi:circadian clock protein KaiB